MNRLDSAGRPEAAAPGSSVVHLADFQPDDASLIRLVLSGDTEQFAPLVRRYQERVRRFILKYEYNTHDAQDLAQETFLQAFRALPSFNHQARFSTWLTGIAFNLLRNHISRTPSKRHIHLDIDDQLDAASGVASHDPARDYENHQLLGAMERAVAALSPPMRDAIVLVASEGLSYEEAAQTLGVPVGTVKSRLCRARGQLADALRIHRLA
ncbi:MAG: sigma-70 family RNA polymerase sigma factor [Hydrogenophaga sp.]|nr:sigma-70 family RNA polymerase sigma factor [Hydrogenophaga sp.]